MASYGGDNTLSILENRAYVVLEDHQDVWTAEM
jgi:hypothetical protein